MSDPVAERTDHAKALAEKLIAWASIAYACGFVIVLLHTARIGIPVLDLVKPIYVWIGLPVAAVLFFARQILGWLRSRAAANRAEFVGALKTDHSRLTGDDRSEVTDRVIDTVAYITPWFLPRKFVQRIFRSVVDRIFLRVGSRGPDHARTVKILDAYARGFRATRALLNLSNLVIQTAAGAGLILLYVWTLYPRLPQAYGGGAPAPVRLLIDTAKLPPGLPHVTGPRDSREPAALPLMTPDVSLLYITTAAYWIQTPDARVIALDKSVVMGIVYESK